MIPWYVYGAMFGVSHQWSTTDLNAVRQLLPRLIEEFFFTTLN